ncbi:MAG: hypothetical protein EOM44_01900 [Bacteroidia bacterium]|nr:hypothetical protein [Bacteroidia bacterium]
MGKFEVPKFHLRLGSYLTFAFREQGIAMLSGVLNSDIAIKVNKKKPRNRVQKTFKQKQ